MPNGSGLRADKIILSRNCEVIRLCITGKTGKVDMNRTNRNEMAHKWVKRLIRKIVINPSNPSQRGGAKWAANRIAAKINSAASCGRNERDLLTIEEIEAELGKENKS